MKLHSREMTSSAPIAYLTCASDARLKAGQALKISAGSAVAATGAQKPSYICVGTSINCEVPAIRIQPDMTFAAPLAVTATSLAVGDKVTIADDASSLTATTTDGVAEITGFETDKSAGATAYCKL